MFLFAVFWTFCLAELLNCQILSPVRSLSAQDQCGPQSGAFLISCGEIRLGIWSCLSKIHWIFKALIRQVVTTQLPFIYHRTWLRRSFFACVCCAEARGPFSALTGLFGNLCDKVWLCFNDKATKAWRRDRPGSRVLDHRLPYLRQANFGNFLQSTHLLKETC